MQLDPPVMKTWRDLIGILTGLGRTIKAKMVRRDTMKRVKTRKREETAAMCKLVRLVFTFMFMFCLCVNLSLCLCSVCFQILSRGLFDIVTGLLYSLVTRLLSVHCLHFHFHFHFTSMLIHV